VFPASGPPGGAPTSPSGPPRYSDLVGGSAGPGPGPGLAQGQGLDLGQGLGPGPASSDVATEPAAPAPHPPKSRGLVIALIIAGVVALLAIAGTGFWLALDSAGNTFAVDSCVKQDGGAAVETNCSDQGAFRVVTKVDSQESCPDPNQPFVVLQRKGADDEVLCLRPANAK
jgi:hypothetical protein